MKIRNKEKMKWNETIKLKKVNILFRLFEEENNATKCKLPTNKDWKMFKSIEAKYKINPY